MPDFAVSTAFRATDRISPAFNRMGRAAGDFGRRGAGAMGRVSRAASSLVSGMRGLLPVFGVAAIAHYANQAIELASDLTEVQNVVDVTFRDSAGQINSWAQTAISAYGLSELEAKRFTGSLGAMMKSSGIASAELVEMSTRLAGLAGDFASFYNLPVEQAFDAIRSGISGETEPLKQLGINMSVANLQAYALSQGIRKNWNQMTQAEQVQLRYNYLMQVSADAQGDFNRTLNDSYANQKRVLSTQIDQFMARLATAILPSLVSIFRSLNETIAALDVEKISRWLGVLVKLIPPIVGGFIAYKVALMGAAAWQATIAAIGFVGYMAEMLPIMRASIAAQGLYNFLLGGTALQAALATIATKAMSIWQGVQTAATWLATTAQWALNAAFYAFPLRG